MRVLITGGGTGGHFFPGLAVAEAVQRRGGEVYWLGAQSGIEARKLPELGIPHRLLPVTGAVGVPLRKKLGSVVRLLPALVAARSYLAKVTPQVVLSVGGYAAFPGAVAAGTAGVPLVLQEQNAFPGLVHRLLAPWAAAIACGLPQAVEALPSLPARFTGNPVRAAFFQLPPAPPRRALAVLGGSQGSQVLNRLLPEALALLPPESRPEVVHQAGERWVSEVEERYRCCGVAAQVVGFLSRPWEVLAQVPLVVARAGALTVAELAAAGRAAVLVPFGQAAEGHQLANARALASTGAAWVIEEAEASPARLAQLLAKLFADPGDLAARGTKARSLARADAAEAVVQLLALVAKQTLGEAA